MPRERPTPSRPTKGRRPPAAKPPQYLADVFRTFCENSPDGFVLVDSGGRFVYANEAAARCRGYAKEEFLGLRIWDVTANENKADFERRFARLTLDGHLDFETIHKRKDGSLLVVAVSLNTVLHQGKKAGCAIWKDITASKRAQEDLRCSQARLAEAERLAGVGSFDLDIPANKSHRSEGIYRLFGVSPAEMDAAPEGILPHIHPDDRPWVKASLLKSIKEGDPFLGDYRVRRPDGTQRLIHAEGRVSKDGSGRPARFFGWLQDITECRELEKKVLQISDRERRNIGQDLHDDLGQQLTGVALLGRALQGRLAAQSSPEAGAMSDLLRHVDRAVSHVRELSRGLASVPTRPEGLMEALAGLASQAQSTSGILCSLGSHAPVLVPDAAVANQLYRIAQEAVHNALRHGRPSAVTVRLAQEGRSLVLSIADNGAGMLDSPKKKVGMGLDIMRHRASLIHGALTLSSHAGKGTEVICRVPLGGGER